MNAAYTAGTGCASNTTWYDQKSLQSATLANFDTCTTTGWLNTPNRLTKDSTNDTITVSDHANLSFTNGSGADRPFSLDVWTNVTDAAANIAIVSKMGAANAGEYVVWLDSSERLTVDLITTNWSSNRISFTTTSSIPTAVWSRIVVTYDGSETGAGIKVYLNGTVMAGSTSSTGTYTGMANTTGNFHIGSWDGTQFYMAGSFGIVKVYKVELNASEVRRNCDSLATRFSVICTPTAPSHIITANATTAVPDALVSRRINKPAGLAVNDLMVVFLSGLNMTAVTPPVGWTYHALEIISGSYCYIYTKIADAGDVAASYYEFTFTSNDTFYQFSNITVYRYVDTAAPITVTTSNQGTGTTATYLGGTASTNSIIYALGTSYSRPSVITGFTEREYNAFWETTTMDKPQPTAGATGIFTAGGVSTEWASFVLLIKGL